MKFPFRFLFFNWSRREKERKEERKKEYELIFFPPVFFCFRRQSWMGVCPANKNKPTKWNDLHFSLTCCWMVIIISGSFKTRLVGERISEKRRNSLEFFKYLSEKKQKKDFRWSSNWLGNDRKTNQKWFWICSECPETNLKWLQTKIRICWEMTSGSASKLLWNYPQNHLETIPKTILKLPWNCSETTRKTFHNWHESPTISSYQDVWVHLHAFHNL